MKSMDVREVLTDVSRGGAYFVDARDAGAMGEAAGALEFSVTRIDLAHCRGKDEALDRMARALQLPEHFGTTFELLADGLGDLSWMAAGGHLLLIENSDGWREADDDNFATLLDVLNEAAASWGERGVPFWALLPLPAERLGALQP